MILIIFHIHETCINFGFIYVNTVMASNHKKTSKIHSNTNIEAKISLTVNPSVYS